ncbi:baseplate J/gp47 family protein [Anaerolentibacter hominis]|uniref:baseplate J/gp47 family protein n=1 Tax=Anaerolentibacter hominis TaxID=3079009 RepID=UPI0031B8AF57
MYEEMTYERIIKDRLDRVPAGLDKREGSVIYNALAPGAMDLSNAYMELAIMMEETYADSASRYGLIKRCQERGIAVKEATFAVVRGSFVPNTLDLAGKRFNYEDLNYAVLERLEDGTFKLQCETSGTAGNISSGELIPVEYIEGLESAEITELLIPGEEEIGTEELRQLYFDSLAAQAFGGNVADYKAKVKALNGVGGVKVYSAPNGGIKPSSLVPPEETAAWITSTDIPAGIKAWIDTIHAAASKGYLTVGGTVHLVIIDSTYSKPSDELIAQIQQEIDPQETHGEGLGLAPIGHFVTVRGVEETPVNITTVLTFSEEWTFEDVKPYIEQAVDAYFSEIAHTWESADKLIVRISQLEARLLELTGISDIRDTALNGVEENLELELDHIPVRGEING